MKLMAVLVSLLSFNAFSIDLVCNVTDQQQAQLMIELGESDQFTLTNFLSDDVNTSLDGGLFKAPYFRDNNYHLEISNECDNFINLAFYDKEVELLKSGDREVLVGLMTYASESIDRPVITPIRCIKK